MSVFSANFDKNITALDISRSTFNIKHDLLATANAGDLNVCYVEDVMPGDTFSLKTAALARMATPIHPSMSNAYMNIEFFFVPKRLVWKHWEEFLGVNKDSYWTQTTTYTVPMLTSPSGGWQCGSLADQMGVPIGIDNLKVSALPFRAYALIYNYFWRNKNLQTPCGVNTDDTNRTGSNGTNYITDCQLGGMPAKACKLSDMFTRALPAPQKGPSVLLPLGVKAPVITGEDHQINKPTSVSTILPNLTWATSQYTSAGLQAASVLQVKNTSIDFRLNPTDAALVGVNTYGPTTAAFQTHTGTVSGSSSYGGEHTYPANLWADLSNATAATVNQLRLAFATQRILEAQARSGCTYQELIHGLFGVTAGDARLQQPEFLGGKSININMSQVVQTSSTDTTSPQGNTAAFSLTYDKDFGFTKSFVEHGYVIGVYTIRNENIYQQGLPKLFSKKNRYDFYFPQLANIGEVGIKNSEIYAQGASVVDSDGNVVDDQIFGYQEAWYEYRYHPNMITGEFRSTYSAPLDSWHYGDDYNSLPVLGSTFVSANKTNIDRTLAVTSHAQFLINMHFSNKATRPLPVYSIPGLIDHH